MLELWEEDRMTTTPLENAAFHYGVGPDMIKTAVSQICTFRTVKINQLPIIWCVPAAENHTDDDVSPIVNYCFKQIHVLAFQQTENKHAN